MSYCTVDDLPVSLAQAREFVTDTGSESDSEKDARIAAVIARAETEVNAYAGVQYTIPLDPVPEVIRDVTARIAAYRLGMRKQRGEVFRADYDDAVRFLKDVASGKATLGPEAGGDPEPPREDGGSVQVNDRVFTREKMKGF